MEQQTLDKSTLILKDKQLLEEVLRKSIPEMGEEEVAIIRARRAYLTSVEREVFKEILEEKEVVVALEDMKFSELKLVCAERGIDVPTTVKSKEAILELIASTPEEAK